MVNDHDDRHPPCLCSRLGQELAPHTPVTIPPNSTGLVSPQVLENLDQIWHSNANFWLWLIDDDTDDADDHYIPRHHRLIGHCSSLSNSTQSSGLQKITCYNWGSTLPLLFSSPIREEKHSMTTHTINTNYWGDNLSPLFHIIEADTLFGSRDQQQRYCRD